MQVLCACLNVAWAAESLSFMFFVIELHAIAIDYKLTTKYWHILSLRRFKSRLDKFTLKYN